MSTFPSSAPQSPKRDGVSSSAAINKNAGSETGVTLTFPPTGSDPNAVLSCFKDENSNFAAVAKACLQLSQFAGCNSSATVKDSVSVASSFLFHDVSYMETVRSAFQALIECVQKHQDRRCRILAVKTLAILARSAYARIRPSPLLYSTRDTRLSELEDEIGAEVPSCLVTAVLDELDDGVSATAMEAIGIMILSNSSTVGTLVEDELQREVLSIGFARPSPYAPSLRSIVDEDPAIPQMELTTRILDNIMAPRLIQIVERIALYKSCQLVAAALPTLTASLVHHVKTAPSLLSTLDRTAFAKRWTEVDAVGLVDAVMQGILLPAMQPNNPHGALAACQAALRLAHACPSQAWVLEICRTTVQVLKQERLSMETEQRISLLATYVIAARGIPLMERTGCLAWAFNAVADLPSTTQAPFGVTSPGALIELHGHKSYRRPARTGLLTEMALSFFMDGPVEIGKERHECLQAFLSSPVVSKIINERSRTTAIPFFDEVLMVFASVAVESGRRFRFTTDGSPMNVDADHPDAKVWVRLARTVLLAFLPCVTVNQNALYLEENLSLFTAGEASYVRLVQMYLHTVGLISAESSVAFKLAANACPPHLLWDPLAESASFLPRFGAIDFGEAEKALSLMDEFVAREMKQGLASHHMRMFLLTLAADAWIEGRMLSVRNHIESGEELSLKANTGRAIATAIGPKRIIAKIYDGHVPPADVDGKKKRDPVKTLAKEAVRASVAVVENIALLASSWRRRFGQSPETKLLVSVTVGILQGKVDETQIDDTMESIMLQPCEAAIATIQMEYQEETTLVPTDPFPISELITQPVKPKIKPLVSNAKPVIPEAERALRNHLVQLTRQVVAARAELCVLATAYVDSALSAARRRQWLRLTIPQSLESKDGRSLGLFSSPMAAWETCSVALSSAASDAVALVAGYTIRRYLRYDGEEEFRVTFLMKAFNTVPIDLSEGLKLDLGVFWQHPRANGDSTRTMVAIVKSLGGDENGTGGCQQLLSSTAVYRQEVKAGEQLLLEVSLDPTSSVLGSFVIPSIVYRNVLAESEDTGAKWTGEGPTAHGDASTATGGESKSGEDDFHVKSLDDDNAQSSETENAILQGDVLALSPLTGLQPCPIVFFCNCWGDVPSFRLLWFSMPFRMAELCVAPSKASILIAPTDLKLARMSTLKWDGEAIPGGFATALWAFMTLDGSRVLSCLVENDDGKDIPRLSMHFRSDDKQALLSIFASKTQRASVVAALCPGLAVVE